MNLKEVLKKLGSTDVGNDLKILEKSTKGKIASRLSAMAKNITNRYDIKLDILLGAGSKCASSSNGSLHITIDPLQAYAPGITFSELYVKMTGLLAHEAGHVLFSDFNEIGKVHEAVKQYKGAIPKIAVNVNKDEIDKPKSVENLELYNSIKKYMFYQNLLTMQNSLEDGSVEHAVPIDNPRVYGGIVAMRDSMVEKEEKFLNDNFPVYKNQNKNILEYFMTELRHMCTIGYRRDKTSTVFLEDMFSKEQIEEMYWMCIYSRICTTTTSERTALSELLLEYFDEFFSNKALTFYQGYMQTLNMSPEDLMGAMDMELNGHTECSIQSKMDPSMAGATKPQNITSDYALDMPQDVQDKINEKMKEKQQEQEKQESSGSGSQSNSDSSSNSSSQPSDSSDGESSDDTSNQNDSSQDASSNNAKEDNEETGQDGENEEGSSGANSGEESDDEMGDGNGEGENDMSEAEDSESSGEDGEASEDSTDEESSSNTGEDAGVSKNADGKVESSADKKKLDKSAEAADATHAKNNALKKYKHSFEKEEAESFKQSVSNGPGKAPNLQQGLGDIDAISDMHRGVRTLYYPSKLLNGISYTGRCVKSMETDLKKVSSNFSKKLKEILMYRAKCKNKTALRQGNINDTDLFRIVTDRRVFKNTIQGIVNEARICVLIDLSGSMCGEKVKDAVAASYMLADACQRINVPISVLGHNTLDDACSIFHFIEFENYHKKDAKEKLLCAEADCANHDSIAIFQSLTDLVRHRKGNEQLIFIVISDGSPAGMNDYYGEPADADIRNIYKSFEKNFGTKTIGIGIGDDVEHIPNIYDNYLLVPNVEKLGTEMLKLLKKILF